MERTERQKVDYELITGIWQIFKNFGDIQCGDQEQSRWKAMLDMSEDLKQRFPEARRLLIDIEFLLNDRAVAEEKAKQELAA